MRERRLRLVAVIDSCFFFSFLLLNLLRNLLPHRCRNTMYRAAVRATSRQARGVLRHQLPTSQCTSSASSSAFRQRFASSVSAGRSRSSWKGSALRWGLAVTAVYYYNTSPVFAEELTGMHELPRERRSEKKKAAPCRQPAYFLRCRLTGYSSSANHRSAVIHRV